MVRTQTNGVTVLNFLHKAAALAGILCFAGCVSKNGEMNPDNEAEVSVDAAFAQLDYVAVYNEDGELVKMIDGEVDFHQVLPNGSYLMDFVSIDGNHSFLPDGRIAFAPQMTGAMPVDGPVFMEDMDAPLWEVEVHRDLEANAHIITRALEMDETLTPWLDRFKSWGGKENTEWENYGLDVDSWRSWSTAASGPYATDRLRVTWELSFAMTGKYTTSPSDTVTCNNSPTCWTFTSSPSGSYYAKWDYDSNNVGYIDYDTAAWSTANSSYGSDGSCAGVWTPCGITVPVGNARNYTCQSSSGSCTSGSGGSATKPHGGECKMFQNLVLYRSGEYNAGVWKRLPSDATITANPATYPAESSGTMNVGDVLRNPTQIHSTIIVAIDSTTSTALVVDSNWVGTTGGVYNEYIGAHVMSFTGSGVSDLDNYKKLDCVYSGGC